MQGSQQPRSSIIWNDERWTVERSVQELFGARAIDVEAFLRHAREDRLQHVLPEGRIRSHLTGGLCPGCQLLLSGRTLGIPIGLIVRTRAWSPCRCHAGGSCSFRMVLRKSAASCKV